MWSATPSWQHGRRPPIPFLAVEPAIEKALLRTHGTVGELEVEVADRIVAAILTDARLLVADVLPGLVPDRPPACQRSSLPTVGPYHSATPQSAHP